jgi:hypothetical protein
VEVASWEVVGPVGVVASSVVMLGDSSLDSSSAQPVGRELDDSDCGDMVCSVGVWVTESNGIAIETIVGDLSTEPIPVDLVSVDGFVDCNTIIMAISLSFGIRVNHSQPPTPHVITSSRPGL